MSSPFSHIDFKIIKQLEILLEISTNSVILKYHIKIVKRGDLYMKATGIVRRIEECVIIGQTA